MDPRTSFLSWGGAERAQVLIPDLPFYLCDRWPDSLFPLQQGVSQEEVADGSIV